MARPKIPTINWRGELARMERFLDAEGGVVHIRTNPDSPCSAFAKALRSTMEHQNWPRPWKTVQFDSQNASTHYLTDMLFQIETTMGDFTDLDDPSLNHITVGSGISAGGNVDIGNISIGQDRQNLRRQQAHAKRVATKIKDIAGTHRLCIIFHGTEDADEAQLAALRSVLWDDRFEELKGTGLLLIYFVRHNLGQKPWLLDADEVLDLPDRYDEQSAANAVEDLGNYALQEGLFKTSEESIAFAKTLVASNPRPRELYANFGSTLLGLRRWQSK